MTLLRTALSTLLLLAALTGADMARPPRREVEGEPGVAVEVVL